MRRIILLFLLPLVAFAPASKSPLEKQLKDFAVFEKVLITKEGRLDLHQSADSMYLYLSDLQHEFSEQHDLMTQYKLFSQTLAKLGCGHTQIHPSKAILRSWVSDGKSLPIDFIMQGKRLYTNKLLSEDYKVINMDGTNKERVREIKGNYEILSIDDKSVSQIINDISPYISSDEDAIDFKYHQISQLFDFYRHLHQPFSGDSISVEYVKDEDTISTYFALGFAPVNTINERLQKAAQDDIIKNKETGTFHIIDAKYGVFRFRSFGACSGNYYEYFLEQSFRKLKSKDIKHLIIDLRGNTGGVMQYSLMRYFVGEGVDLGRYVVEKPKKGFETTHLKKRNGDYRKHKWMSRIQRLRIWLDAFENGKMQTDPVDEELVFKGNIIVLTDEGTFSSASMLACHLKTLCNAKLYGRPAGGSFYRGNAGTLQAVLPNSKFKLMVNPNTFYSQLPTSNDPLRIKQPDVLLEPGYIVPRKIDDFYIQAAIDGFKQNSL